LNVVASISGNTSDSDRTVKIVIDPSTTASPLEYSFPNTAVIKAGTFSTVIPVTVKKSSRLDDRTVKLVVKLESNEDFETSERSVYRFVWTNDVVRPSTWDSWMWRYFGNYSKVKHRLIISSNVPPYTDLELYNGPDYIIQYVTIRDNALLALSAYNAVNPPLKNEYGDVIGFCNGCR
jgi:hypothetical protein